MFCLMKNVQKKKNNNNIPLLNKTVKDKLMKCRKI